jgi:hypothetical protein
VTTAATYTANGVETRVCNNDASHVETRVIPRLSSGGGSTTPTTPPSQSTPSNTTSPSTAAPETSSPATTPTPQTEQKTETTPGSTSDATGKTTDDTEKVADDTVPLVGSTGWSLVNLLMTLVVAITTILSFGIYLRRKSSKTGSSSKANLLLALSLGSAAATVVSIILFFLTQSFGKTMGLVDQWTVLHVVIAAIAVVLSIVGMTQKDLTVLN